MCIVREMQEELCLKLSKADLMIWKVFRKPKGIGRLSHVFVARNIDKSKLRLQEGEAIVYASKNELLGRHNLGPITKELIEEFRQGRA